MTVTYEYDNGTIQNPGNGRLKSATGEGTFKSTDGFGSLTSGSIKQDYEIDKFYKALMVKSTTRSMTENGDGTTSWMGVDHAGKYYDVMSSSEILGEALVVDYIDEVGSRDFGYERGSDGKLTGEFISGEGKAARGRSVSLSKDVGDFNFTKTEMYQEYTVVNGQARMTLNTTKTYSVSVNADWKVSSNWVGSYEEPGSALDGSRNRQTINTRYTFETRKGSGISTGVLTAASGSGTGWSSDGLGSETWNLIRQNYDSVKIQQFGKALLTENITASYTKNFDGSESWTGNVSPILVAQLEAAQKEYEGAQKELSAVAGAIGSSAAVSPAASGEITSGAPVVPSVSGDLLEIQGRMLKIKSKIDGIQAKIDFFSARSSRTEAMTVTYFYDGSGKLMKGEGEAARGHGVSVSKDEINNSMTEINQTYTAFYNNAKVVSSNSKTWAVSELWQGTYENPLANPDGSISKQEVMVYYAYDRRGRQVASGGEYGHSEAMEGGSYKTMGKGSSWSNDGLGNITRGTIVQTYAMVGEKNGTGGEVKIVSSRSKSWSDHQNIFGSYVGSFESPGTQADGSWTRSDLTIRYNYNQTTRRQSNQEGRGTTLSNDGFDNYTKRTIQQVYTQVKLGLWRLSSTLSSSWSCYEKDIVERVGNQKKIRDTGSWNFKGWISLNFTDSPFAFVEKFLTDIQIEFGDWEFSGGAGGDFGSAIWSEPGSKNADGTWSKQQMTTEYHYDANGKQNGQIGIGNSYSSDGFGNFTAGVIIQKFQEIAGQFKATESKSYSWTADGRSSWFNPTFNFISWDDNQSGSYAIDDSAWSLNYSGHGKNLDGTWSAQVITTTYVYDNGDNDKGILTSQTAHGETLSNDGFGNYTRGTIDQYYKKVGEAGKGQTWKVDYSVARSWSCKESGIAGSGWGGGLTSDSPVYMANDGSWSKQEITTSYQYDENGKQDGQSALGATFSNDGFGNFTKGAILQKYALEQNGNKFKSFKLISNKSFSWTSNANGAGNFSNEYSWNINPIVSSAGKPADYVDHATNSDGSWSKQEVTTTYTYDANGVLSTQSGSGNTFSNDGFDNYTRGSITQTFEKESIPNRSKQLKLVSSETKSWSSNKFGEGDYGTSIRSNPGVANLDGSWSKQIMKTGYLFTAKGKQKAQYGVGGTFSNDGFGNCTEGRIIQKFQKFEGAGAVFKIKESTSYSWSTQQSATGADAPKISFHVGFLVFVVSNWSSTAPPTTKNLDDSWSKQVMTTTYVYNETTGQQTDQYGIGSSFRDDGFQNFTKGTTIQKYAQVTMASGAKQFKVKETKNFSWTSNESGAGNLTLTRDQFDQYFGDGPGLYISFDVQLK